MATLMSLVLYIVATCMTAYARAECSSPDWVCPHCTFESASTAAETSVFPIGTYLVWGCEENYAMEGPSDVIVWICGADSQWSGEPTPNCAESITTCPDPPVPAYGEVNPAGVARYRPGDTVQYSCKTGYQLMGSTDNTCGNDHSWGHAAPTCQISATVCNAGNLGALIGTDNAMVMTSRHSCIIGDNLVNDWLSQETMTSNDAKNTCRDRGGSFQGELALIKTPTMQEDVRRLLNQPKAYGFDLSTYLWIGVKEGRNWKWSNVATGDSNIYRLFWADGRPSEVSGTSCISLSSSASFQWVDAPCSSSRRFICQYDGSCTGRSSEHAARLIDERRKCYWFSNSKATWSDAKTSCSSEGGSLVKVTDESLQYVLANEAANVEGAVGDWWIGGYDDVSATERAWFWVDNTRATFMSWESNEPNNPSDKCVEVNSDMEHDWNDENCNSERQAMCQIGIAACGDPGAPSHGTRSPGDRSTYLDGAVMHFFCDPGYDLHGNTEITCQPNGEWDNAKPSCTAIYCGNNPHTVHNAVHAIRSHSFRGTTLYTCNQGLVPSGNPISHCQANSTWSRPDFQCNEVTVPPTTTTPTTSATTQAPDIRTTRLTTVSSISSTSYLTNHTELLVQSTTVLPVVSTEGNTWSLASTAHPPVYSAVRDMDMMMPIGIGLTAFIIVIAIVISMVIWRRRHVKNSSKTRSIDAPVYDSIGNEYKVAFNPNTEVTIGISNDAYTTLNVGSMETIETHESRYMALGEGVTGRSRADTESTDPRGHSNTANSTTLLVPVDDEGYASLRSTHQLPYMSLSHGRDCNQGSGNDLFSGDVGGREGGDFDQLRSALESHRSSVDTNSNAYETLETPRPSIDMGVLRKQGSLGENEYEELDYTEINSNKDVDQSTKQQSPRPRIDAAPKSNPSEADAMANTNTDTTYNEVDDKYMIFNDLYRPSGSDFVECGRSSKTHIANTPTSNVIKQNGEERMSTYDKVDDATLLFNDLYQPSVMAEDLIHQVNDKIKRKASASSESAAHPNPYYFCLNPSDDTDPIRAHGVSNIRKDVPLAGMSLQTKIDDSSRENVDGKLEDIESPPNFTLEPPS